MMCLSKGNRKSRKDRQYNDQMQNEKRTNNDLQNRKLKNEQYESYKKTGLSIFLLNLYLLAPSRRSQANCGSYNGMEFLYIS